MGDTLISLQRRQQSAEDLGSVVRTMKAMATSSITQYEMAVHSLQDYYHTISLGLYVCFNREKLTVKASGGNKEDGLSVVLVFGSDQGLVGRFNDTITTFVQQGIKDISGQIETWAVGESAYSLLTDRGYKPTRLFNVPNSVSSITPLVNHILIKSEEYRQKNRLNSFYIFHNSPLTGAGYQQESQRLFPPDEKWEREITKITWPSKNLPQVIGDTPTTFRALIREYLFVSIYKACAESLAAENASRLEAMQRAEKNINDMRDELKLGYNRLRQSTIDAELFDVIAGFEAIQKVDR